MTGLIDRPQHRTVVGAPLVRRAQTPPARADPRRPEASSAPTGRARWWRDGFHPLLTHIHFHAGLFVGPFVLVAAVTGLLDTISPQLEQVVRGRELRVPVGVANQLVLAAFALGLTCMTIWGCRMWWTRRPPVARQRWSLAPPSPPARSAHRVALVTPTLVGLIATAVFPVFGVSLLAFLLVDEVRSTVRSSLARGSLATAPPPRSAIATSE